MREPNTTDAYSHRKCFNRAASELRLFARRRSRLWSASIFCDVFRVRVTHARARALVVSCRSPLYYV